MAHDWIKEVFPWRVPCNCQWQYMHMAHDWLKAVFYVHGVFHGTVNGNRGTGHLVCQIEYFISMECSMELSMANTGT
jgi:hypothetical protein